jgi:formate hydrogenlyase subunit 3/multisubunit Na+/H+ antiporter MnhD subunit
MTLLIAAVIVLVFSGMAAALLEKSPRFCSMAGAGGVVAAGILGLIPVFDALSGGSTSLRAAWHVPYGSFFIEIDPLSAFFLLPTFVLSALAAVYGAGYLEKYSGRKSIGGAWFHFNLLVASIVMLFLARNVVLFLVAWELMSIASWFLVAFEDEKESAREAARLYLVAMHIGTAFLLVLFLASAGQT